MHLPHGSAQFCRDEWRHRRAAMEAESGRSSLLGRRRDSLLAGLLQMLDLATRPLPLLRSGRRNAAEPSLTETVLRFPDLPAAFDGYTLLHLSDLHPHSHPGAVRHAAELVATVEADLAVLTGDIQTNGKPAASAAAAAIAPVIAGLRTTDGIFSVLGNHDGHAMVPALEGLGIRMLINESQVLVRGGDRLVLTGTDDVHRYFTPAAPRALHAAPSGFGIALVHSPELAAEADRAGVRLYLCGHTHGGQICLRGGRPLLTALDVHRKLGSGAWRLGGLQGYTTRGVGVSLPAVRYNCPGEIARITLRRG